MTVVSNASPLIVLAKLNMLHLLRALYGRVHLASSVYDEVVTAGIRQGYEDASRTELFLRQEGWTPEQVDQQAVPEVVREAHLDTGERDTLALAASLGDALVLMDETSGRQVARALGLPVRGSLGVLIEAYHQRLIGAEQLHAYLTEVARRSDIWISRALIERLLAEIGT